MFFITELFDPLGTNQAEVSERLGTDKFCYFNSSPVQPESSLSCGYFCCYWIQVRLLNSDKPFQIVLNSYFTTNVFKNQAIIDEFIETGKIFDENV